MIYNNISKYLLLSMLWILPAMGMNGSKGAIQSFHDMNPAFITWSVSQGAFKKANIPQELRHKLIEDASIDYVKDYIARRQKFVGEMFMINLSLQDILFSNQTCLDGIKIINDAKASHRYDQSWNSSQISFTITLQDYNKTFEVPFFIRMKALQENSEKNIPAYHAIPARVIIHPDLIECGAIAYKDYFLAFYPSCSYFDR